MQTSEHCTVNSIRDFCKKICSHRNERTERRHCRLDQWLDVGRTPLNAIADCFLRRKKDVCQSIFFSNDDRRQMQKSKTKTAHQMINSDFASGIVGHRDANWMNAFLEQRLEQHNRKKKSRHQKKNNNNNILFAIHELCVHLGVL